MTKELMDLRNSVNEKRAKAKALLAENKIEEAKALKDEILADEEKFDLMMALEDDKAQNIIDKQKDFENSKKKESTFGANIKKLAMNQLSEGTNPSGGYTVPVDISTKVEQFRDAKFSLRQLVSVESVNTDSGERTYQNKSTKTGFTTTAEAAALKALGEEPTFKRLPYNVSKRTGYLACTEELLDDSDANIEQIIIEWLADEDRVTANRLILTELEKKTATPITDLDDIRKAVNVTLGSTYKNTSSIITNDLGINWLDTLKDANGRPLLQPNLADPTKMYINFAGSLVPVISVPVKDLPNTEDDEIPFIVGDLKEAVKYFERKAITIKMSDTATVGGVSAFENGLTYFAATERQDVKVKDEDAYVYLTLGE